MGNNACYEQKCRICGCTWDNACPGGCFWVKEDLCSECAEPSLVNQYYKEILQKAREALITAESKNNIVKGDCFDSF